MLNIVINVYSPNILKSAGRPLPSVTFTTMLGVGYADGHIIPVFQNWKGKFRDSVADWTSEEWVSETVKKYVYSVAEEYATRKGTYPSVPTTHRELVLYINRDADMSTGCIQPLDEYNHRKEPIECHC